MRFTVLACILAAASAVPAQINVTNSSSAASNSTKPAPQPTGNSTKHPHPTGNSTKHPHPTGNSTEPAPQPTGNSSSIPHPTLKPICVPDYELCTAKNTTCCSEKKGFQCRKPAYSDKKHDKICAPKCIKPGKICGHLTSPRRNTTHSKEHNYIIYADCCSSKGHEYECKPSKDKQLLNGMTCQKGDKTHTSTKTKTTTKTTCSSSTSCTTSTSTPCPTPSCEKTGYFGPVQLRTDEKCAQVYNNTTVVLNQTCPDVRLYEAAQFYFYFTTNCENETNFQLTTGLEQTDICVGNVTNFIKFGGVDTFFLNNTMNVTELVENLKNYAEVNVTMQIGDNYLSEDNSTITTSDNATVFSIGRLSAFDLRN